MSEQWWAVKRDGVFLLVEPTRRHADQELVSHYPAPEQYSVVPVRIVEDAGPCEWELSPFGEASGEPNTKTWLNFITDFGYKYCPQCGRKLEVRCDRDQE